MMERWQFNILFFVGVGAAVLLFIGPEVGFDISKSPSAVTGVGAILTYVLAKKDSWTKPNEKKRKERQEEEDGTQ